MGNEITIKSSEAEKVILEINEEELKDYSLKNLKLLIEELEKVFIDQQSPDKVYELLKEKDYETLERVKSDSNVVVSVIVKANSNEIINTNGNTNANTTNANYVSKRNKTNIETVNDFECNANQIRDIFGYTELSKLHQNTDIIRKCLQNWHKHNSEIVGKHTGTKDKIYTFYLYKLYVIITRVVRMKFHSQYFVIYEKLFDLMNFFCKINI